MISSVSRADASSQLSINNPAGMIGNYFSVLSETDQQFSLKQAQQAYQQGKFMPWDRPVLSFGIGAAPKWLVVEIENPTEKNLSRRLVIENSWLDKADIYILHNKQITRQLHLGDIYPFVYARHGHKLMGCKSPVGGSPLCKLYPTI
ncbi:MAG: hypothetical protein KZQ70_13230, partial [gamma proteobacterium symbiont of Lucinoma myriamae]|nr:hypothetical protein [gamma proteobacterium symbiont of Lucinoma myriamae]MCU7818599.1 hypothetical protein [gamma proteobacterium symbiont of Lucinoma myriamae]MCU7833317.1 hypothetical protein [gamma proteobacterium symbiont of Lucinoma myriamae]